MGGGGGRCVRSDLLSLPRKLQMANIERYPFKAKKKKINGGGGGLSYRSGLQQTKRPAGRLEAVASHYTNRRKVKLAFQLRSFSEAVLCSDALLTPSAGRGAVRGDHGGRGLGSPRGQESSSGLTPGRPLCFHRPAAGGGGRGSARPGPARPRPAPAAAGAPARRGGPDGCPAPRPAPPRGERAAGPACQTPQGRAGQRVAAGTRPRRDEAAASSTSPPPAPREEPAPRRGCSAPRCRLPGRPLQPGHLRVSCRDAGAMNSL